MWLMILRILIIGVTGSWGLIHLFKMLGHRDRTVEFQSHLLAALCGLLLAGGVMLGWRGLLIPAILIAAIGVISGIGWFAILHKQSLHNTSM